MYQAKVRAVAPGFAKIATPSGKSILITPTAFYSGQTLMHRTSDLRLYLRAEDIVCFDLMNETSDKPQALNVTFRGSLLSGNEGWGIVEAQNASEALAWSPELGCVRLLKSCIPPTVFQLCHSFWEDITQTGTRILFTVSQHLPATDGCATARSFSNFKLEEPAELARVFGPFRENLPACLLSAPAVVASGGIAAASSPPGISSLASVAAFLPDLPRANRPAAPPMAFREFYGARPSESFGRGAVIHGNNVAGADVSPFLPTPAVAAESPAAPARPVRSERRASSSAALEWDVQPPPPPAPRHLLPRPIEMPVNEISNYATLQPDYDEVFDDDEVNAAVENSLQTYDLEADRVRSDSSVSSQPQAAASNLRHAISYSNVTFVPDYLAPPVPQANTQQRRPHQRARQFADQTPSEQQPDRNFSGQAPSGHHQGHHFSGQAISGRQPDHSFAGHAPSGHQPDRNFSGQAPLGPQQPGAVTQARSAGVAPSGGPFNSGRQAAGSQQPSATASGGQNHIANPSGQSGAQGSAGQQPRAPAFRPAFGVSPPQVNGTATASGNGQHVAADYGAASASNAAGGIVSSAPVNSSLNYYQLRNNCRDDLRNNSRADLSENSRIDFVDKYGIVVSLRRDGCFVWCDGFPALFAPVADVGRHDFAPFDVVLARIKYDPNSSSHCGLRFIHMRSVFADAVALRELTKGLRFTQARAADFRAMFRCCTLVSPDRDPGRIILTAPAFPCFIPGMSEAVGINDQLSVAFAESIPARRGGERFIAVAILPRAISSIEELLAKSAAERRRLFDELSGEFEERLRRVNLSARPVPPSQQPVPMSRRAGGGNAALSTASTTPPDPIPAAGFARGGFGVPPAAAAQASSSRNRDAFETATTGLICTSFPDKVCVFSEMFGLVEFCAQSGPAGLDKIYRPYQTVELQIDVNQTVSSQDPVTKANGIHVIQKQFDGFEKLLIVEANVCKVFVEEQRAVLSWTEDRILCPRSAHPDGAGRLEALLPLDSAVYTLVCENFACGAENFNCRWLALRVLMSGTMAIGEIQRRNGILSKETPHQQAAQWFYG